MTMVLGFQPTPLKVFYDQLINHQQGRIKASTGICVLYCTVIYYVGGHRLDGVVDSPKKLGLWKVESTWWFILTSKYFIHNAINGVSWKPLNLLTIPTKNHRIRMSPQLMDNSGSSNSTRIRNLNGSWIILEELRILPTMMNNAWDLRYKEFTVTTK